MTSKDSTTDLPSKESRVLALDGVRGVAILCVLICHGVNSIPLTNNFIKVVKAFASFGTFGVDLFFVLSGFLITKILLHNHRANNLMRVFWARRIARIAPLYLLFLAVMYTVCLLFIQENLPSPPWWSYVLYLQNFFLAKGCAVSSFGFDITWSLVIEEHFYLIFPFLIAVSSKKYHLPLILLFCFMGIPGRLVLHPFLEHHYNLVRLDSLYLTGRIDELGLGALLAFFYVRKYDLSKWWLSPFTCILLWFSVGILFIFKSSDHFLTGSAGFVTIACTVSGVSFGFRKFFEISVFRFFGRISYALYLFHTPLFWMVKNKSHGYSSIIYFIIAVGVSVGAASISTYFFEEPIQKKVKNVKYRFGEL
jgi:peptidoglycan/LPS O-acetylase OafA/YrhL